MTHRQQEKKKENFKPKTFQLFASHLSQINILKCCLTFLSSLTWQSQFLEIWFLLLSPQALNTIRFTSYYASVVVVRTNLICNSRMFCSPPCHFDKYFYNYFYKYFYNYFENISTIILTNISTITVYWELRLLTKSGRVMKAPLGWNKTSPDNDFFQSSYSQIPIG